MAKGVSAKFHDGFDPFSEQEFVSWESALTESDEGNGIWIIFELE
ncbi:MAG: hypothetical protein OXC62_14490 [Aestuariivita sp.]|nr:hypothetical protein [Aestuariivita sp.]